MKAWNKMHDPKTDGAIQAYNFCGDQYCGEMDGTPLDLTDSAKAYGSLTRLVNKQGNVGRC